MSVEILRQEVTGFSLIYSRDILEKYELLLQLCGQFGTWESAVW